MKTCTKCGIAKPFDQFYRRADSDGYKSWCKGCEGQRTKAYRLKRPELFRQASRKWRLSNPTKQQASNRKQLLKKYGLTVESFEQLLESQCGCCAICNQPLGNWHDRAIDHCHETGDVRSILCGQCNTGLGKFKESPALLISALEYLAYHGTVGSTK